MTGHSSYTFSHRMTCIYIRNMCFSNYMCISFQAFIFWVVDNFLKHRTKNTKTIYVNDHDQSVHYNRSEDTAKLYNRIERMEDGDSDILMSTDEDGDARHRRHSENDTERLIS